MFYEDYLTPLYEFLIYGKSLSEFARREGVTEKSLSKKLSRRIYFIMECKDEDVLNLTINSRKNYYYKSNDYSDLNKLTKKFRIEQLKKDSQLFLNIIDIWNNKRELKRIKIIGEKYERSHFFKQIKDKNTAELYISECSDIASRQEVIKELNRMGIYLNRLK